MNEIVSIKYGDVFTDSLIIADRTGFAHHTITRKVRDYKVEFGELGKLGCDIQPLVSGQKQKIYLLNEPQASYLITLLENNKAVRDFKLRLVKEFYRMRIALVNRSSTEWLQTRMQGKLIRREETDTIADLIQYAKRQGSKNADKMYLTYTKLVNNAVGIQAGERETASYKVLSTIGMLEDMILHVVKEEMDRGAYYKEIYKKCKHNTEIIVGLAYLEDNKKRII